MKPVKPTFKKHPRSLGLAGIGEATFIDIKVKKKVVGSMHSSRNWGDPWRIGFKVYQPEGVELNCPWCWFFVKNTATDEAQARAWVIEHYNKFAEKYKIWVDEDD